MDLQSARYLSPSKQSPSAVNAEPGWHEIRMGLAGILLGYFVLLSGGAVAVYLHHLAYAGDWAARAVNFRGSSKELFFPLAGTMIALTLLLGTFCIFRGQWRCLKHSPSVQNGKE